MRSRVAGGFTLIEVLVAVLVLALGIIGAAGTELAALRTRQGAALMSAGVQLASTLAERMRANALQMQAGDGANPYLHFQYNAADGAPPQAQALCYGAGSCTSGDMAGFDLYEISAALHSGFPGGRVAVCRDARVWDEGQRALTWSCAAGPGAPVVIKLGWRRKRADGAADTDIPGQFAPAVALVFSEGAP